MKVAGLFENLGWKVVLIKYGKLLQAVFREPGGERLRRWIDDCPNQLYSALVFEGAKGWRRQLETDLAGDPAILAIINRHDDASLARLMTNLGGHDLESVLEAFDAASEDQPVCFIAYTIKGFGLPFQGHKDNHAGLMNKTQMQEFRVGQGINQGEEWDRFAGLGVPAHEVEGYLARVPFVQKGTRRLSAPRIAVPPMPVLETKGTGSTQAGFGRLLDEIARSGGTARRPHSHHLGRCHGLDQPRPVGQPARPLLHGEQGGRVQAARINVAAALGDEPEGPAHRARHRRDEPVPAAGRGGTVARALRRAAAADRHAV